MLSYSSVPNPLYIQLCQEMSELTAPECANVCLVPHSCCDSMYCDMAESFARDYFNIILERTDHPKLKFMGPNGCTVAPHLRPICTVHVCSVNSFGCKPKDAEFTKRYFELRDKIDLALYMKEIK